MLTNLAVLKHPDEAMVESHEELIENVPGQYTQDGFSPMRQPVTVTSRFGQNQKLADTEEL